MLTTSAPTLLAHVEHATTGHGVSRGALALLAAVLLIGGALLTRRSSPWLSAASLGSLLAGTAHAVAAGDHFQPDAMVGTLFVGVAIAQIGLAALLRYRPTAELTMLAASGNLLLVAVWAVSRTTGLP